MKECSLLISNDTGPILLAGLLGKPTFSLYGPTNPLLHKFPGKHNKHLQYQIKCSPLVDQKMCFTLGGRKGCPFNQCMKEININTAKTKIESFIGELNIAKRN